MQAHARSIVRLDKPAGYRSAVFIRCTPRHYLVPTHSRSENTESLGRRRMENELRGDGGHYAVR